MSIACLRLGGTRAIAAWRGPNGDEHDFDIGSGDLEVKATLSEKRVHWMDRSASLNLRPGVASGCSLCN